MSNDRVLLATVTEGLGQLWRRPCCKAFAPVARGRTQRPSIAFPPTPEAP